MKGVFLDDERNPEDVTWVKYPEGIEWTVVRNFDEFKELILSNFVKDLQSYVFSFDHDLADFENGKEHTGVNCLRMLAVHLKYNKGEKLPTCYFHTQNIIGFNNLTADFKFYQMFFENT